MLERGSALAARADWAGVSRLANVTGLDIIGIPVIAAIRPQSRSVTVSHGKGMTIATALASAVHESCELFAAEDWQGESCLSAHEDLDSASTYPLECMPRFAGGPNCEDLSRVAIPWVCGRRLADDSPIWLPLELVGMNQQVPAPRGYCFFAGSATGLAASDDADAAILHALCEVIERDRFARWRRLRSADRHATALRLGSASDPECRDLASRIQRCGLSLLLFDMTGRLGVPCILAEIFDFSPTGDRVPYSQGMAASPDKNIALRQAILEAAQSRLGYISGTRDDLDWYDYWPLAEHLRENRREFLEHFSPSLDFGTIESIGPHALRCLAPLYERELSNAVLFRWEGMRPSGLHIVKVIVLDLDDGLDHGLDVAAPAPTAQEYGSAHARR
jgi:ribosomal protein S12 methylthiotransferase accessory factor